MALESYARMIERSLKRMKVKIKGVPVEVVYHEIPGLASIKRGTIKEVLGKHADEILSDLRFLVENRVCIGAYTSPHSTFGMVRRRGFEIGDDGFAKRIEDDEYRLVMVLSVKCTDDMKTAESLDEIGFGSVQIVIVPLLG